MICIWLSFEEAGKYRIFRVIVKFLVLCCVILGGFGGIFRFVFLCFSGLNGDVRMRFYFCKDVSGVIWGKN